MFKTYPHATTNRFWATTFHRRTDKIQNLGTFRKAIEALGKLSNWDTDRNCKKFKRGHPNSRALGKLSNWDAARNCKKFKRGHPNRRAGRLEGAGGGVSGVSSDGGGGWRNGLYICASWRLISNEHFRVARPYNVSQKKGEHLGQFRKLKLGMVSIVPERIISCKIGKKLRRIQMLKFWAWLVKRI